jgi:hypothetical protein
VTGSNELRLPDEKDNLVRPLRLRCADNVLPLSAVPTGTHCSSGNYLRLWFFFEENQVEEFKVVERYIVEKEENDTMSKPKLSNILRNVERTSKCRKYYKTSYILQNVEHTAKRRTYYKTSNILQVKHRSNVEHRPKA